MIFDFPAKSGKRRVQGVVDPLAIDIVCTLKRRRGGGQELLAYKAGRTWYDVRSDDINAYLKQATGGDFSAKDFRTWNATVLAALALAVSGPAHGSKTSRKRAITRAIKETAHYLGNTPAVCRASYIDPRVFDAFRGGLVLDHRVLSDALEAEPGQLPDARPEGRARRPGPDRRARDRARRHPDALAALGLVRLRVGRVDRRRRLAVRGRIGGDDRLLRHGRRGRLRGRDRGGWVDGLGDAHDGTCIPDP